MDQSTPIMLQSVGFFITLFADRYRGHSDDGRSRRLFYMKQFKRGMEAFGITLCAGIVEPLTIVIVTVLVWAGICLGSYGNAIGPAVSGGPISLYKGMLNPNDPGPEWWQRGILLRNVWLALIVVGLIWGAPALLAWRLDQRVIAIPFVFMLAFPLSCDLAYILAPIRNIDPWALQQKLFGPITAIFLVLFIFLR